MLPLGELSDYEKTRLEEVKVMAPGSMGRTVDLPTVLLNKIDPFSRLHVGPYTILMDIMEDVYRIFTYIVYIYIQLYTYYTYVIHEFSDVGAHLDATT